MEEKKKVPKKKKILIGIIITTIVLVAVIVTIVLMQNNAEEGLTIDDLLKKGVENFIGSKVIGYDDYEYYGGAGVGWEIFYIDESNIYLIADNYISYECVPYNSSGHKPNQGSTYLRSTYWSSELINDYEGSESITDEKLKALNNSYYSQSYSSTNNNMKAVAYMMDTDAWSVYAGSSAEYAIGGTTIELLLKSYNAKYGTDYQAKATSEWGYEISTDGGSSWSYYAKGALDTSDSTYVISSSTSKAHNMWVASPSAYSFTYVMCTAYNGYVGRSYIYSNTYCGFRPIVCLKSEVRLQDNKNGTYTIIYDGERKI